MTSIKVLATDGKPTLCFIVNEQLKQLILLDGDKNKFLKFHNMKTIKDITRNLIVYEI